jgi:lipopolysaccharide transport system permease protein
VAPKKGIEHAVVNKALRKNNTGSKKAGWHFRIQPSKGWAGLSLRELWPYRDLFWILAVRDVKLRYKQTALGITWVILQPILTSGIFAVVFGTLAKLPSDNSPYLLFAYAGTLPWILFSQSLSRAGGSLVGARDMISKVYFPRMILPIASTFSVLVDFLVGLVSISVLFLIYKVPLTWNLLAIPGLVLVDMIIAIGVSFWVSAFSVHYRDFIYVLPFLTQAWMYASPVAYSSSIVPPAWKALYALNPMVGIIDGFRWALLGQGEITWASIGISLAVGVFVFILGAFVFRRIERSFADVI